MSDGHMNIIVYSYLGHLKRTIIGYPYVDDRDDWDVAQKNYNWVKSNEGFNLDKDGRIYIEADAKIGVFDLEVDVTDHTRGEHAKSFIHVDIRQVPESAFQSHVR